jgi:hypothetical protein
MRYKDEIQCAGAELLARVRSDARALNPQDPNALFYALHIRRGDFQYKVMGPGEGLRVFHYVRVRLGWCFC